MRLLHYSRDIIGPLADAPAQRVNMKPFGLWVSVEGEDDWLSWCRGENFGFDRLATVQEITLVPDANVIQLGSSYEIDAFTREYLRPPPYPTPYQSSMYLDWPEVAGRYDGIIIAPYVWSRRLDGSAEWYYGWDCASGCIWRASAVADVKVLAGCAP